MAASTSAQQTKQGPRLAMAPCVTTPPEAQVEGIRPAQLDRRLAIGKRETFLISARASSAV